MHTSVLKGGKKCTCQEHCAHHTQCSPADVCNQAHLIPWSCKLRGCGNYEHDYAHFAQALLYISMHTVSAAQEPYPSYAHNHVPPDLTKPSRTWTMVWKDTRESMRVSSFTGPRTRAPSTTQGFGAGLSSPEEASQGAT